MSGHPLLGQRKEPAKNKIANRQMARAPYVHPSLAIVVLTSLARRTKFCVGTFDVIAYNVTDFEKVGLKFGNIVCSN